MAQGKRGSAAGGEADYAGKKEYRGQPEQGNDLFLCTSVKLEAEARYFNILAVNKKTNVGVGTT